MLFFFFGFLQFLTLSSALFSSSAQESAPVPLNGNFRKPQLIDSRIVLISFKEGMYDIQNDLARMNDLSTALL